MTKQITPMRMIPRPIATNVLRLPIVAPFHASDRVGGYFKAPTFESHDVVAVDRLVEHQHGLQRRTEIIERGISSRIIPVPPKFLAGSSKRSFCAASIGGWKISTSDEDLPG